MEVEATREHEYPTMDRKAYKVVYPYTCIRPHVAAAILGAEKGLAMDQCKGASNEGRRGIILFSSLLACGSRPGDSSLCLKKERNQDYC